MSQPKSERFMAALMSANLYKPNQGRVARQLVGGIGAALVVMLAWAMSMTLLGEAQQQLRIWIPVVIGAAGVWVMYRSVNWPQFADFLIDVQHEMTKVSWPTWSQLKRSSAVVLAAMGIMGSLLFIYDLVWGWLLRAVWVLRF